VVGCAPLPDMELWEVTVNQIKKLGFEEATIGIELGHSPRMIAGYLFATELEILKESLPKAKFLNALEVIDRATYVKDAEEIKLLKQAAAIADAAQERVRESLCVGMSEMEIAGIGELEMRRLGSEFHWPVTGSSEIASGHRTCYNMGGCTPPTEKLLQRGENLLVDLAEVTEDLVDTILRIELEDGPPPDLTGVQALLFTSANGVRAFARRCEAEGVGPVTSTSLNRTGALPALTRAEALSIIGGDADGPRIIEIDAAEAGGDAESTVVDVSVAPPRVLRWGSLRADELESVADPLEPVQVLLDGVGHVGIGQRRRSLPVRELQDLQPPLQGRQRRAELMRQLPSHGGPRPLAVRPPLGTDHGETHDHRKKQAAHLKPRDPLEPPYLRPITEVQVLNEGIPDRRAVHIQTAHVALHSRLPGLRFQIHLEGKVRHREHGVPRPRHHDGHARLQDDGLEPEEGFLAPGRVPGRQARLHLGVDLFQGLGVGPQVPDDLLGEYDVPAQERDEERRDSDGPLDSDHGRTPGRPATPAP